MASQQHNRPDPADHTGRKAEEAREAQEAQMRADQEAAAAAEREAAENDERQSGAVDDEIVVDEPEEVQLQAADDNESALANEPKREMRVNADIEAMVYGRDMFTFKKGTRYLVPKSVYEHLNDKGYVYHLFRAQPEDL